jgi:uncharacterized Zn finger protein
VRETVAAKAARLAGSGRVTLRRLDENLIVASVRGDSARVYDVEWNPDGWWCTCPAMRRCSHIRAVQLVVLEPLPSY